MQDGGGGVLGKMDVTRMHHPDLKDSLPVHKGTGTHPPASGGHQLRGGGWESALYTINDVHQARLNLDVGGCGIERIEHTKGIG